VTVTRSASVVAATVGTVLTLAAHPDVAPSPDARPAPHPDAARSAAPLQPVVLQPPAESPADTVATGAALAAAHRATAAALSAAGHACEDRLAA
jgi:hypothetical protein